MSFAVASRHLHGQLSRGRLSGQQIKLSLKVGLLLPTELQFLHQHGILQLQFAQVV